jgi:Ca-activated chloride channel family protein
MFRFQDIAWLQLMIAVPTIVTLALIFHARQRRKIKQAFGDRLTPFLTSNVSEARRTTKLVLEGLALTFLILSLARPQLGQGKQDVKSQGVELMLALDVSTSMLAEDQKPNRLTLAKRELNRLLDKLTGDRVGLIAFAGSSVLVAPLTNDYSSVRMFLDSLSPESVSTQGTSFAHVIDTAMNAFKRGGISEEDGGHVTRVLLLATDGEVQDNTGLKLADAATKQGIRIFTLGFGTRAGAPIPLRDERGNLEGYKKDKSGRIITTAADDEVLSKLARAGKGNYQHSTFTGEEIDLIVRDIDKLEKSTFDTSISESYNEYFQLPLLAAMILMMSELILADRRRDDRKWKGRFEVSGWVLFFIFLSANFVGSTRANAESSSSPRAIWENNHAATQLEADLAAERAAEEAKAQQSAESGEADRSANAKGRGGGTGNGKVPDRKSPLEVRDRLVKALAADNENAVIHLNLGLALDQMKDTENSIKEFETAARLARDEDVKFSALFDLGALYGRDQKIDEALLAYERALAVKPDSKETKTNIELLFAQKSGGGGQGQQQPKPSKDDKGEGKGQQPQQQPQQPQKQQPHPFQAKDLTKQDVDKILDELKRQEEEIRGRINDKQHHEAPPDKDW